jgi:putative NADPH-quinone reductase
MDDDGTLVAKYKEQILNCDAMCFVFPWWFEMPPFPLVKFFQSIFVEGFAYTHDGEVKTPKIKLPVQVLITMGQRKEYNIRSLRDGMDYVGLRIERELVCTNVGPRLEPELSERYLESALRCGKMFF